MKGKFIFLLSAVLAYSVALKAATSPQSGMFFKNRMAPVVRVADCSGDSAPAKMMATALQGVINRDTAQVYIQMSGHHAEQLRDTGRPFEMLVPAASAPADAGLMAIVDNYSDRFTHIYIWNPDEPWTWNLALMLSARNSGMPLTAEMAGKVMARTGWHGEVDDLSGRFASNSEAYRWAIDHLMPGCHRKVLFSVGLRDDWRQAPWTLYDYVTASGGFAFWLDDRDAVEQQIIRDICEAGDYSAGAIVMGYAKSGDDLLATVNNYGIGYVVSDYYANASFWCSYANAGFEQRRGIAEEAQNGKIYVSIVMSDGDNLQFCQNALYNMWTRDPARGEIPVGTTLAAGLQEINPFLLGWYYAHKTPNDELMAGPSGYQFIYGRDYDPDSYDEWLEQNRRWLASAGFQTGCLWHTTFGTDTFNRYIATSGLKAIFDGDDATGVRYVDGVVVMNQGEHLSREWTLYGAMQRVKPDPDAPVFVNLYPIAGEFCGGDGLSRLKRDMERLEAESPDTYRFLLPKDLAATAARYFEKQGQSLRADTE